MFKSANYIIQIIILLLLFAVPGCFSSPSGDDDNVNTSIIADHNVARLAVLQSIPDSAINNAKTKLHIAYGHTSHGSQIVDGVNGLVVFMNGLGRTNNLFSGLDLKCDMGNYTSTYGASDLNQPNYTAWTTATRNYLSTHTDINVVIWSWCAGVSHATESQINNYLALMNGLEEEYPGITFIYMTGHLDGTGVGGELNVNNERIRKFCRDNGKWLYDFADIESYDPDSNYYLKKAANDACNYDSDGNGSLESNWATAWQNSHTEDVDWYSCSSAHSQPLNANMKAYAFWWLMARVAGWSD